MAKSKKTDTGRTDPSLETIQAIDKTDLKALSYIQLRHLHATVTQTVTDLDEELKLRAEEDSEADTVIIPVKEVAE